MRRKTLFKTMFFGIAMLLMMAPGAMAGTVIVDTGAYSVGNGGEFVVSGLPAWITSDYSPLTRYADSHGRNGVASFCLEYNEYFVPGTAYSYKISSKAINGGVVPAGVGDRLSKGTAFLYSQFAQGLLTGYNYTGSRLSGKLQQAIWYLEEEITLTQNQINLNPFLQALITKYGSLDDAKKNADIGEFGVYVLNLYDSKGKLIQDQLVYSKRPIPEPASMLLIGFGLAGLALFRRKSSKS